MLQDSGQADALSGVKITPAMVADVRWLLIGALGSSAFDSAGACPGDLARRCCETLHPLPSARDLNAI